MLSKTISLQRYRQLDSYTPGVPSTSTHDRYFITVYAYAFSLLDSEHGAGIDYYEGFKLLNASIRTSLENANLALLPVCAAGRNILAQSWLLAGQAVRVALGKHEGTSPLAILRRGGGARMAIETRRTAHGLGSVLNAVLGAKGQVHSWLQRRITGFGSR